jgi:hypothetical protein
MAIASFSCMVVLSSSTSWSWAFRVRLSTWETNSIRYNNEQAKQPSKWKHWNTRGFNLRCSYAEMPKYHN